MGKDSFQLWFEEAVEEICGKCEKSKSCQSYGYYLLDCKMTSMDFPDECCERIEIAYEKRAKPCV